jgi:toxin ParE1/3/4
LSFRISELALEDLESIWSYTAVNWSSNQADRYYEEIISQINTICDNPQIGMSIAHIKDSHRKVGVNSHMIIYKVVNDVVFVDRILHMRMDIDGRLGDGGST